jgi:hypothetical protein
MYGRSDEVWDELTDARLGFLVERARLRRTTSYTELNATLVQRTGLPRFEFERADERTAMGELLGRIVERTFPTTNLMISTLVIYLNENDAGSDFYALAKQLGLLAPSASKAAREAFWVGQVNAVYGHYR